VNRNRSLPQDLRRLQKLAFRRHVHCAPLLEKFFTLQSRITASGQPALIWNLYDWLLVPLSLWPIDFEGTAHFLLEHLESGRPFPPELSLLLRLIDSPPPPQTQAAIAQFEHDVESGRYEKMLKQSEKFDEQEKALLQDQQLTAAWNDLKRLFKTDDFRNSRGVIRRRMSQERNFRNGWQFDWSDARRRFYLLFDALCYRWKLYGMEHDRPLLLKLSINPTPHGTMIVIPRHWSLDPRRDLQWTLINRLHRAQGAKKQGPKMSLGRIQKLAEAKKVKALWQAGKKRGLKGELLHNYICAAMHRDLRTDPSWWKRLLR
jgi:hypothetical protein